MYCIVCDQKARNLQDEQKEWSRIPVFRIQKVLHDNHWCNHAITKYMQDSIETITKKFDKRLNKYVETKNTAREKSHDM